MSQSLTPAFEIPAGKNHSGPTIIGQEDGREITVTHMDGFTIVDDRPVDFKKFRIIVTASYDDVAEEARRKLVLETESRLGFKFPNGAPVVHGYAMGYEFEGEPAMELPEGWALKTIPNEFRPDMPLTDVVDEQGRFRGRLDHHNDRSILHFWPRYVLDFNSDIRTPSKRTILGEENGRTMESFSLGYPYYEIAIRGHDKDEGISCFIYAPAYQWPMERFDFSRIKKEMEAIEKAKTFIAEQTNNILPGAALEVGLGQSVLKWGREALAFGHKKPGDIFAHWGDDTEEQVAKLRAILEATIPEILGKDNSLVLATFPTKEDVEAFKENVPFYEPPAPQTWQKPIFWGVDKLGQLFNREP